MKNKIMISSVLTMALLTTSAFAQKESSLETFLNDITKSGQLRVGYVNYDFTGTPSEYSTAIGGHLRFETPIFNDNFTVAITPYFGASSGSLSGSESEGRYHTSLSGVNKSYMTLGEAYFGFKKDEISFKIGRQIIDTPLLGNDDMRLTPQTFEGIMANYEKENWGIHAGYLTKWQGYDEGLNKGKFDYKFGKLTTDSDGALVLGTNFSTTISEVELNTQAWYYDIDKLASVGYGDVTFTGAIGENIGYDLGVQFTSQSEKDASGYDASLYGLMAGLGYGDFYLYTAYAKSSLDAGKMLFNGLGGTFYYTAGNEWSMGYLDAGENETSTQIGLSYDFLEGLSLSAYHTDFKTDSSHIKETDIFFSVFTSEKWDAELVYTDIKDKKGNQTGDYTNILFRANYNF
ncbi:OprD family porin [Sulfurospirillum sp.]|nr:OprD family porin [Sulfurospirillum sp.]